MTNVEYNSKYVKVFATTFNDQIHDTKLNLSCQNYVPLANIFWYLEVLLPESATDKNYRRKLFSTTVNLQKLFNGVKGISILSAILDAMRKSASFAFKFPFETVGMKVIIGSTLLTFSIRSFTFKGVYNFTNLVFATEGLLIRPNAKTRIVLNMSAVIKGTRKYIWLCILTLTGEMS